MKHLFSLLTSCLFLPALLFGQANEFRLKGKIVDSSDGTSIPYVSIGVKGTDLGTVSNENGAFELAVGLGNAHDTLVVAMVGYKKQFYEIKTLSQALRSNPELSLEAAVFKLQEVEIASRQLKTKVLGNEASPSSVGMTPFKFSSLGNEIGLLCKVKGKQTYLEEFNVDIYLNDYDTLFFRLNIYTLEGGLPKENILNKPIYLEFTGKKGKASINLVPYNISVNEDFVVSLEYVKKLKKIDLTRKEQSGLYFGAKKLFGGTVYSRNASQGDWIVSNSGLFAPKMEVVVKN